MFGSGVRAKLSLPSYHEVSLFVIIRSPLAAAAAFLYIVPAPPYSYIAPIGLAPLAVKLDSVELSVV